MRTDYAARRYVLASEDLATLIAERQSDLRNQLVIDQKTAVQDTLRMLPKAVKLISDLKMCIIRNRTNIPFFTSDDLAVQANRFRIQRQRFSHGGVGLMNAGLMFFLPLTPT